MRAALPVTAIALIAALTGCGNASAEAPAATETVTAAPSASLSPKTAPANETDDWAQQIESTIVKYRGTWEEQCQESDFPVASCFIEGLGSSGDDQLTVTLDLTPEKVPDLEIPFDEYREIQAEEAFPTISHAFRQIDELPARPEQIKIYDAQTEDMIGFADSDNGGLWEWYSFSD